MPPAAYKAGPELQIELDHVGRLHQPCQAGGVITGRVVRTAPGVSPCATVCIRLLGRAKTKITVTRNNGQGSTRHYYRNRFNFFEPTQTRQFLLDGPLHIAQGSAGVPASWPFNIHVPRTPSPRALLSEGGNVDTCFLSLRPEDVARYPLPASFAAEGRHHNVRFEAYVEYQLEATLTTSGSHAKEVMAVLPVSMSDVPMRQPLTDWDIHRRSMPGMISTYRLIPGMEKAELSFKQKTRQLFGSSTVPSFGYTLHVDCPAAIQLGNPTPVPFMMRIVPERNRSSEVVDDVEQAVVLNSLEIVLKAHTAVIAPTTFSKQSAHDTVKHSIALPVVGLGEIINPPVAATQTPHPPPDAKMDTHAAPSTQPPKPFGLVLPSKWQAGDDGALNVGAALDLRLFSTHAEALGRSIARTSKDVITPGFETYCIRHSHTLKYKITLEIAGRTVKQESEQTVTIVGPSEPPPPLCSTSARQAAGTRTAGTSEELPAYGVSTQMGGPSNGTRAEDGPVEELPSYTK